MLDGKILIVRHGEGRGRHPGYMDAPLARLRRKHPAVYRRLVLHSTGTSLPPLDGIVAVVFWLADPLREYYPDCHAEAAAIAAAARERQLRIINPPEAASNSIKSVQARLWTQAHISTPPVERFDCYADLLAAAERLPFPVLARSDQQHGQRGALVLLNADALLSNDPNELAFPCAIAPLIDVRTGYQDADPSSPLARLFHKRRLIVAGSVIRTKHTFFAETPIVCARSSLFERPRSQLHQLVPRLSVLERQCVEIDMAYWAQREEHRMLMTRACAVLGFEFAAIDYSNLADGTPILWEANPYFMLPRPDQMRLPYIRSAAARIDSYYDAIGDFLAELVRTGESETAPAASAEFS